MIILAIMLSMLFALSYGQIILKIDFVHATTPEIAILDKLEEINQSVKQTTSNELDIYIAIGSVGAAIASTILTRFFYSLWKRPKLEIRLGDNVPGQGRIYLHGVAINEPHRYLPIQRHALMDATAHLTFYDLNNDVYLFNREKVEGKWVSRPRCLSEEFFDESKVYPAHHMNIHSDSEGESFDIAIKNQGNNNCYAFNCWSYFYENEENPSYSIGIGRFKVKAQVYSGIHSSQAEFILENSGSGLDDILISEAPKNSRSRLIEYALLGLTIVIFSLLIFEIFF
jgi:hypothetical protein